MEVLEIPAEPEETTTKRRGLRPEWILAIIAAAAALLLGAVLLMSRSYFPEKKPVLSEEDPEILLHQQQTEEDLAWPPLEQYMEPTVPETEPENPTIPPERNPYDQFDFQFRHLLRRCFRAQHHFRRTCGNEVKGCKRQEGDDHHGYQQHRNASCGILHGIISFL